MQQSQPQFTRRTSITLCGGYAIEAHEQAQILQSRSSQSHEVEGDLLWVQEMEWMSRRLIVSYSSKRAHKDKADRQKLIDKLNTKLGKTQKQVVNPETGEITMVVNQKANAKKLISNSGYLKYIEQADTGGFFLLDEDKLENDALWDCMHAIVTSDHTSSVSALLTRYRRLWMIEDSFRLMMHNLAIRPIYHFKPERIKAHIGICFMAFALIRHAQFRIQLAQKTMSVEDIRNALHSVQASILEHKKT